MLLPVRFFSAAATLWLLASCADAQPTEFTRVAAGCYVHTTFAKPYPPTNGLVVRTETGAVLIDTGWNASQARD